MFSSRPPSRAVPFDRPKLYRENLSTQYERNTREIEQAAERQALQAVRRVSEWFEVQRELGNEFTEDDFLIEASSQLRRHAIRTEFIPGATEIVRDIYSRSEQQNA